MRLQVEFKSLQERFHAEVEEKAEVKARVAAQLERDKFELEIRAKVDAELKKYSMTAREGVSGPWSRQAI